MKMRFFIATVVFLCLLYSPLVADPADPDWYDIDITQDSWLASNTHDLVWGGENLYVGHIDMEPKHHQKPDFWDPEITLVFTSSHEQTRLVNTNDPDKYFPCYLTFPIYGDTTGTYYVDRSPFIITTEVNWYAGGNLNLTIPAMSGDDTGYEGTYTTFFRIRAYTDYGTDDEVLLAEEVLNIVVYYKTRTPLPPGETVFTNLLLQRYAAADNIDVVQMQQTQSSLTVGSVTFSSTDRRRNVNYLLRISPAEAPATGVFAFHKTSGIGSTIPYKVHIPGRTTPTTSSFDSAVPEKGPAGYWQDFIEIAISNFDPYATYGAGQYTSRILIELIVN